MNHRESNLSYKTVCDKCGGKTWYETEQPCKREVRRYKACGHCFDYVPCTGTLKKIDYSGLDARFLTYYKSGQRVEVTWKKGFEDFTGYGSRTECKKARFIVGMSTGWKPCLLAVYSSRSYGGPAITSEAVESVRALS